MATAKAEGGTITLTLTLNNTEARLLKATMQNPPQGYEYDEMRQVRKVIFDALEEAGVSSD